MTKYNSEKNNLMWKVATQTDDDIKQNRDDADYK